MTTTMTTTTTTMEVRTATMMDPDLPDAPELPSEDALAGWLQALAIHGAEPEEHTRRVTHMAMRLGHVLGLSETDLLYLRRGALLHDLGHLGVPEHILYKPDRLTTDEWTVMRQHPLYARKMLAPIEFLRPSLDVPLYHHERWDGSGYPEGLQGETIPLMARIFAVADVWDVLSRPRPYRAAWNHRRIADHIRAYAGIHFDPLVVRAFDYVQTGTPLLTQVPRTGYVKELPLLKMLALLRMQQRSGVIVLIHGSRRGIIAVQEGYTIDAYIVQQGQRILYTSLSDAIQQMLSWEDAAFAFQDDLALHGYAAPPAPTPLRGDTMIQLATTTVQRQALLSLRQEHWHIMAHLSGSQRIETLAAAASLSNEAALSIVQELLTLGIVEVVHP
jgi:hypothetical protein